jgi:hypothetical protein
MELRWLGCFNDMACQAEALSAAKSEGWWRRRELNPRPETFRAGVYIHVPMINFAILGSIGPEAGTASLLNFIHAVTGIRHELSC